MKGYVIDVRGFSEEKKKRVQDAFFKMGFKWGGTNKNHYYLDAITYTSVHYDGGCGKRIMHGGIITEAQKPYEVTYEELMKEAGMEEESGSDWFERDELPPVGEICKLVSQGMTLYGFDVEITYIGDEVGCYKRLKDNKEFTFASSEVVFSPIKSERDRLIEQAKSCLPDDKYTIGDWNHCVDVIEKLIDTGWRPIKQQSEDEFVETNCTVWFRGDKDASRKAYRAGCRFLDVDND